MGSSECESIEKYKFEAMENGESFNYQGNAKLEISILSLFPPIPLDYILIGTSDNVAMASVFI